MWLCLLLTANIKTWTDPFPAEGGVGLQTAPLVPENIKHGGKSKIYVALTRVEYLDADVLDVFVFSSGFTPLQPDGSVQTSSVRAAVI